MPDQTIALQLNLDTNAPATIDSLKQEFEELEKTINGLDPDKIAVQFTKFGDTATNALKGIGMAAELASQNNADLESMINKSVDSATKVSAQNLISAKNDHVQLLKETEDFQKSNLDISTRYQANELSGLEQTAQEKKKILDSEFTNAKSAADSLVSLTDLMVENGKKNTEAQKATALIQIGIDTAKAISSLVAASNENPANAATSGIAGVLQFAAGITEILVNIAKAKDILDGGSASGGTASSSPTLSTASANLNTSAPTLSIPSQTSAVSISRSTSANTRQEGTIKAYVVESEITNAQKRASTLRSQSLH